MAGRFHPRQWLRGLFALAMVQAAAVAEERVVPRVPVAPLPAEPAPSLLPDVIPEPADAVKPGARSLVPLPPDLPPLGLPSDGEPAPSFPDLPDLPESSIPAAPPPSTVDPPEAVEPGPAPAPSPKPAPPGPPMRFPVWHKSPAKGRDAAMAERRCLLVVFSSGRGAMGSASKQLSNEVFARPDFNEFALEHLVLVNLYYSEGSIIKRAAELAREEAMTRFRDSFKVRGFPTAILFTPEGREIDRHVGYRTGRSEGYFQRLKQSVEKHEAVMFEGERRRERLASQGYRTWTSATGLKRFAKLIEFDAHHALLRDESGAEMKVAVKQLALPDREIISRHRLGRPLPKLVTSEATTESPRTADKAD